MLAALPDGAIIVAVMTTSTGAGRILRASERESVPWLNGLGSTSEVAIHPTDAAITRFDWRISIATIETDSRFSEFAGVDRYLMPLSADGVVLVDEGVRHPLARFEVYGFAGERSVEAVEVREPSLDLNLMLRRGAAGGSLVAESVHGRRDFAPPPNSQQVLVVLDGALAMDGIALGVGDSIRTSEGDVTVLTGEGLVAVATMTDLSC